MPQAKKPLESTGMKKDVERQQEKMRELFEEIKKTVSRGKWDESPRDFFTALEKKLSRAGIDKNAFADFIMHEVEMPLRLSFSQSVKAWNTEELRGLEDIGDREVQAKAANAISDEMLGIELVTVAKCLKDIAKRNTNLGQFFWEISEKDLMERSRNFAKGYINFLEIAELDKLKHRKGERL